MVIVTDLCERSGYQAPFCCQKESISMPCCCCVPRVSSSNQPCFVAVRTHVIIQSIMLQD